MWNLRAVACRQSRQKAARMRAVTAILAQRSELGYERRVRSISEGLEQFSENCLSAIAAGCCGSKLKRAEADGNGVQTVFYIR